MMTANGAGAATACNKWGGLTADASYAVEAGTPFTLRLVFSGADVRVLVDGIQVAHGTIDDPAISQEAGHIGFRVWGDGGRQRPRPHQGQRH